jgi:hypothetical protein
MASLSRIIEEGLVYFAAHALDEGETEVTTGKKFPNATKAVTRTTDDFLYLDPVFYPADFAAELTHERPTASSTRSRPDYR